MAVQQTLSGTFRVDTSVTATHQYDLVVGTWPLRNTQTATVSSAASAITSDLLFQDSHSIAGGGAPYDYDFNAPLTDYTGATMAFDRIHMIYIRNTTTGAAAGESVLTIGADASPWPWFFGTPATDTIEISPGGWVGSNCGVDAGWAVGAGATDTLQFANNDAVNAANWEIIVIGESVSSASTTTTTTAAPTTTTAAATTTT